MAYPAQRKVDSLIELRNILIKIYKIMRLNDVMYMNNTFKATRGEG